MNKKFTWQELKDIVNSLDEEQLKNAVTWWGDERGGRIEAVEILNEDYVDDQDGHSMPISEWESETDEKTEIIFKKGTPILWSEY